MYAFICCWSPVDIVWSISSAVKSNWNCRSTSILPDCVGSRFSFSTLPPQRGHQKDCYRFELLRMKVFQNGNSDCVHGNLL